jgi:hypothetical protein
MTGNVSDAVIGGIYAVRAVLAAIAALRGMCSVQDAR